MKLFQTTFAEFLQFEVLKNQTLKEDLSELILNIANSCRGIRKILSQGYLGGDLGAVVDINVQEEDQKKLDVISNSIILEYCAKGTSIKALASEEMEKPVVVAPRSGKYLMLFDPLDGSSNIEINGPVGTIISILPSSSSDDIEQDFLQPGSNQVAAIYVLYGPSTNLVLTLGNGTYEFTLSPVEDEFFLTGSRLKIPIDSSEFGINSSNYRFWEKPVRRYVEECLEGKDGARGRDFNMRWVGAMACDVHRVLSRGGTFMYPMDEKLRKKGGRLRLMYEANPMSFIIEQAGGLASTGYQRILDVQPTNLHQRIPVILGSKNEIELINSYHTGY